ncbi:hypothetical protein [Prosthecobacter sp.]|uniref:hypothetical protein n=1 Tax=Prosthecobacter sp. TaxID=1965333 RepID=UPI003783A725
MRARALNKRDAQACVFDLAAASGEFHGTPASWFYGERFHLYHQPEAGMKTNCVGFVASALAFSGLHALLTEYSFPYHTPLAPPVRTKPTVGHLARALSGCEILPFRPTQETAETYASCRKTHWDALSGHLP